MARYRTKRRPNDWSPTRAARTLLPERIETFPMQALHSIREFNLFLDEVEVDAIKRALELGASREEIAHALGVTRQGVDYKLKRAAENGDAESALPISAEG